MIELTDASGMPPYEETTTVNSKATSKLIRKWTKDVSKMDRRCMPKINKDMKICPISSHREMCMKSFQPSKDSGLRAWLRGTAFS